MSPGYTVNDGGGARMGGCEVKQLLFLKVRMAARSCTLCVSSIEDEHGDFLLI